MELNRRRMIGYKVLQYRKGLLKSWTFGHNALAVVYREKKLIKPRLGKLFVFSTLPAARDFRRRMGENSANERIFRVTTYGNSKPKLQFTPPIFLARNFWEAFMSGGDLKKFYFYDALPPQTYFCSSLRLIEEVK